VGLSLGGPQRNVDDAILYCVVPPRLERLHPRLREHYAEDPAVQVVVDRRIGERRVLPLAAGGEDISQAAAERRGIDGRRASVPAGWHPPLPLGLRRFENSLRFQAVEDRGWRRRSLAAEHQAAKLAEALEEATSALRSRWGLSPIRSLRLIRAEEAVQRYYRWRAGR